MYYRPSNIIADNIISDDCTVICVNFTVPSERFEFKIPE